MKFQSTPNRCISHQGEQIWISRSVTVVPVTLFVVSDEEAYVPLGKRGTDLPDEQGKWGLAGGYLDYDETAGGAVIREIWEELGLDIPALQEKYRFEGNLEQPYFVYSEPLRRQNVTLRFPLMFFLESAAELPKLKPQVSKGEVVEARWYDLEEALSMQLAFKHQDVMRQCLEIYYQSIWPSK
ncbi:MAG: NUDIX hydrolase [Cyanobacteria bacterium P01_A01_bin.17]